MQCSRRRRTMSRRWRCRTLGEASERRRPRRIPRCLVARAAGRAPVRRAAAPHAAARWPTRSADAASLLLGNELAATLERPPMPCSRWAMACASRPSAAPGCRRERTRIKHTPVAARAAPTDPHRRRQRSCLHPAPEAHRLQGPQPGAHGRAGPAGAAGLRHRHRLVRAAQAVTTALWQPRWRRWSSAPACASATHAGRCCCRCARARRCRCPA